MTTIATKNSELTNLAILYLSSLSIIFILAYMDEGYYSFAWMADLGSWIAVALFSSAIFLIEFLIYRMIVGLFSQFSRPMVSVFVGGSLLLAFLFLFVLPVLQN